MDARAPVLALALHVGMVAGCGGQGWAIVLINLISVPAGTSTVRVTAILDGRPERDPADLPPDRTRVALRLADDVRGVLRVQADAFAGNLCAFASGQNQTLLMGLSRVEMDIVLGESRVRTCNLSVIRSGSGAGWIESDPQGITCGLMGRDACFARFQQGIEVTLTARPDTHVVFDGWTGPCRGTAPCIVRMDQSMVVSGSFSLMAPF